MLESTTCPISSSAASTANPACASSPPSPPTSSSRPRAATKRAASAPVRSAAALTASVLLATLTKGAERVTVQIEGDGPLGGVVVDANVDPARWRRARLPRRASRATEPAAAGASSRRRSAAPAWSTSLRDLGLKEQYQGQVALITGEIDEDVESYLRISEQVPSALGCEVVLDGTADRRGRRASWCRRCPAASRSGASVAARASHRHAVSTCSPAATLDCARAGRGASTATPTRVLGEQPLRFHCRCSRERIEEMLHAAHHRRPRRDDRREQARPRSPATSATSATSSSGPSWSASAASSRTGPRRAATECAPAGDRRTR